MDLTVDRNILARGLILGLATLLPAGPAGAGDEGEHRRSRTFEVAYRATVRDFPEGTEVLDLWLPLPRSDRNQSIGRMTIQGEESASIADDPRSGNRSLHVRAESPKGPVTVRLSVEATRREDSGSDEPLAIASGSNCSGPSPWSRSTARSGPWPRRRRSG